MVTSDHALTGYCRTVILLVMDWKQTTTVFHQDLVDDADEATLQAYLDRLDVIEQHAVSLVAPGGAAIVQRLFLVALAAGQVYVHALFGHSSAVFVERRQRIYQDELIRFLETFESFAASVQARVGDAHRLN